MPPAKAPRLGVKLQSWSLTGDLRFQIKQEYETGMEANNADGYAESRDSLVSHLASNLLMLANRRLEIEPTRSEAEEFVRQHCDLDDDLIEGMWISKFS